MGDRAADLCRTIHRPATNQPCRECVEWAQAVSEWRKQIGWTE